MKHSFALYRIIQDQPREEIKIQIIVHTSGNIIKQVQMFDKVKGMKPHFIL